VPFYAARHADIHLFTFGATLNLVSETTGRSYAGQSADERDAQRRARLLEAAREIIGTLGYAATTIPGVCAAAKVSTRHFYRLYSTKEDLFVDLYDQVTAESYVPVVASLEQTAGRDIRERVPTAMLAYLAPMLNDARVARIAFVEIMGASPRIEKLRLDYRETLIALVEREGNEAVARGEIAERDWRFAALALVGAATAIVYDWMLRTERPSVDEIESALAALALDLITR
jgi:AcrR family transcriptional regulator